MNSNFVRSTQTRKAYSTLNQNNFKFFGSSKNNSQVQGEIFEAEGLKKLNKI